MSEIVSRILLEVNGKADTDFDEVEEGEIELNKPFELQDHEAFFEVLPKYRVKVKKVIPMDIPEVNYSDVKNGRLTIDRKNGTRIVYMGVYFLKKGATKYGKEAATYETELGATSRDPKA